jgi:ABC-2 type transport system permease protein
MNTIISIVRKEFLQIFRDPMMLRIIFLVPLIQLFILGYTITLDVRNVGLVVRDEDRSELSRQLVEKVIHSRRFRIVGYEQSQMELKSYFEHSLASVSLAIPRGFEEDLLNGRKPELQVLLDGVDSNTSAVAMGYLQRIIATLEVKLPPASLLKLGSPASEQLRIDSRVRVWFNPNLESKFYILPGIVAFLLTMTTTILTGMGIVREREIGTLEQLSVTPIRSYQLILGKTIPFAILGFVLFLMGLSVVSFWYGIHMAGSLLLLLVFTFIFLLTTLGVGLFVSTLASTQLEAVFITFFFIIFALLMSGLFAPIHNMPPIVQKLTYLNPLRYFIEIIRGIYLKGSGLEYLWKDGLILLGCGSAILSLSILRFKKRVD